MMFYFLKKNRILLDKINNYLETCAAGAQTFEQAFNHYITGGNDAEFEAMVIKIRNIEGTADEILYSIETSLYEKSLLPESREDIDRLFERVDDIIDDTTHILRFLNTRNVPIPENIVKEVREMIIISLQCFEQVRIAINELFGKRKNIVNYIRAINNYETACDDLQANIIKQIFASNIDKFDKIILTELVNLLSKLTDHCEDSADVITIINVKRVV
jgi:predicted phosphate transport protein (TIGR00153 family)